MNDEEYKKVLEEVKERHKQFKLELIELLNKYGYSLYCDRDTGWEIQTEHSHWIELSEIAGGM